VCQLAGACVCVCMCVSRIHIPFSSAQARLLRGDRHACFNEFVAFVHECCLALTVVSSLNVMGVQKHTSHPQHTQHTQLHTHTHTHTCINLNGQLPHTHAITHASRHAQSNTHNHNTHMQVVGWRQEVYLYHCPGSRVGR
jgi:hypothetical protein